MDLLIIIILTLLILLGGRTILWLATIIFWLPYLCFIFVQNLLVFSIAVFLMYRVQEWKLGYIYKLGNKIIKELLKTEEFKTMKGVRFETPHDFVCKEDMKLPQEERTIFKVRYLTVQEQAEIRDLMYSVKGIGAARKENFLTGSSAVAALNYGLLGWKNFKYEDTDDEIPFSKENFSCIPPAQRDEIANHIRGTEEEA